MRAARVLCDIPWYIVGLMNEMNKHRPVCGFISYADDLLLNSSEEDANDVRKKIVDADWHQEALLHKHGMVVLGREATERDSVKMEASASFWRKVEKTKRLQIDTRKLEALWMLSSKSIARGLDFNTSVVHPVMMRPLAAHLDMRTKTICEKLVDRRTSGREPSRH